MRTSGRVTALCIGLSILYACNKEGGDPSEPLDGADIDVPTDSATEKHDTEIQQSCEGVSCWNPPDEVCNDEFEDALSVYSPYGYCDDGECHYIETVVSCPVGLCKDDRCEKQPCHGVICNKPPSPACLDGAPYSHIQYDSNGTCSAGTCIYQPVVVTCNNGGKCINGSCEGDVCKDVSCNTPDAWYCVDDKTLRTFAKPGVCYDRDGAATCDYPNEDIVCEGGCDKGQCKADPCQKVTCTTPPARYCDGDDLVVFDGNGRCEDGGCDYGSRRIPCDNGCEDGSCIGQKCIGVTCTAPPASSCISDTVLRAYPAEGACDEGACRYEAKEIECEHGCDKGRCIDSPCAGVTCNIPPSPACVGDALIVWNSKPGECVEETGLCRYFSKTISCDNGCKKGQCIGKPCEGVFCTTPEASYCDADGETLISFSEEGKCEGDTDDNAVCAYDKQQTRCEADCKGGRCTGSADTETETGTMDTGRDSDTGSEIQSDTESVTDSERDSDTRDTGTHTDTERDTVDTETATTRDTETETGPISIPVDECETLMMVSADDVFEVLHDSDLQLRAYCSSDGASMDVTQVAHWSIEDETVSTVSNDAEHSGLVTGGRNAGATTVTCEYVTDAGTVKRQTSALLVLPDGLTVSPPQAAIEVGETQTFTTKCRYSSSGRSEIVDCDMPITWETSNDAVFHIDLSETGPTIDGIAYDAGSADVTASFGVLSSTAEIAVSFPDLNSITISAAADTILVGETLLYTARCNFANNTIRPCTGDVTWRSSHQDIAQINANGEARGLHAGITEIDAHWGEVPSTQRLTLTVSDGRDTDTIDTDSTDTDTEDTDTAPDAGDEDAGDLTDTEDTDTDRDRCVDMTINIDDEVYPGTQAQATAHCTINGEDRDVSDAVTWRSDDTTVATVFDDIGTKGLITGVALGNATITAEYESPDGSTTSGTSTLTVSHPLRRITIAVDDAPSPLIIGQQFQIDAICDYNDNRPSRDCGMLDWNISDESALSIDPRTNIATATRLENGDEVRDFFIRASFDTGATEVLSNFANLTVYQPSAVRITPVDASIRIGDILQYEAECDIAAFQNPVDCTDAVTWRSSVPGVATISEDGNAEGLSAGACEISALLDGFTYATSELTVLADNGCGEVIDFPDAGLREAIAALLGKNPDEEISYEEALTITSLSINSSGVSNLTGMQCLNNLTNLILHNTNISDLSPLAGLTNLRMLDIHYGNIDSVAPLAGLVNLTELHVSGNNIEDISPLAGLTQLTGLCLWGNHISDIGPLAGLSRLTALLIYNNEISDISPLVANTGFSSIDIHGNPLDCDSANVRDAILALENRGVYVNHDCNLTNP